MAIWMQQRRGRGTAMSMIGALLGAVLSLAATSANASLSVTATKVTDGTGTCTLDTTGAPTNNGLLCTNDQARYNVAYSVNPTPPTQANVTLTVTIPATEPFRFTKTSPGLAACSNQATAVSVDGKTITCTLKGLAPNPVAGPIANQAADIVFDVLTSKAAKNGDVLAGITAKITSTEDPTGATSIAPGVTVLAQPQLNLFKKLNSVQFAVAKPAGCAAAGTTGILVDFGVGLDLANIKGHEALADGWTYTEQVSSLHPNACLYDVLSGTARGVGNPWPAVGALNPDGLNAAGGTYTYTTGGSGNQTITAGSGTNAPNTSGDVVGQTFGYTKVTALHYVRIWISNADASSTTPGNPCLFSGANTISNFDPNGLSGTSNLGPATETLVDNTVAVGPYGLCAGSGEKLFTSNTKGTSKSVFQAPPRMSNEVSGPNDFVDTYTYWNNAGFVPRAHSHCDKWDNRKLQLDLLDPAVHRSDYGGTLGTGSNYQYQTIPASGAMTGDTSAAYSHIWISSSGLTSGPSWAGAPAELEYGFVGGGIYTDEQLRAAPCSDGDSTLGAAAASAGITVPASGWVKQSFLKANPGLVPFVNAMRGRDITVAPGGYFQIFTHLKVLAADPFTNAIWPDGTIIPNYWSIQTDAVGYTGVAPTGTTWYHTTNGFLGNDPQAVANTGTFCNATLTTTATTPGAYCDNGFVDRLRLATESVGVRKGVAGIDPLGGPLSDTPVIPKAKGDIVTYQLWPVITAKSANVTINNDIILEDTLPPGLKYVPASAKFNGIPIPASDVWVQDNAPLASTIKFRIPNVVAIAVNSGIIPPVEFDAEVMLDDPLNVASRQLVNKVVIQACAPGATIDAGTGAVTCNVQTASQTLAERTALRTIQLAPVGAIIVQKSVIGAAVKEIGSSFTMGLRYLNSGSTAVEEHRVIDILPYNGEPNRGNPDPVLDKTSFNGTRPLTNVVAPNATNYQVFYTTAAPATIDASPKCPSNTGAGPGAWPAFAPGVPPAAGCTGSAGSTTWTLATQAGTNWTGFPAGTTAILLVDKNNFAPGDPSRLATMTFPTTGSRDADRYSNNVSAAHGGTGTALSTVGNPSTGNGPGATFNVFSNNVTVRVIAASIQGTVFVDPNLNGAAAGYEAGTDTGIGGVTVTLTQVGTSFTPRTAITATAAIPAGQYYNPATGGSSLTAGPGLYLVPAGGLAVGQYLFGDLLAGPGYQVVETQPAGYVTTGDKAGNGATPGTVTTSTDTISAIALTVGQAAVGYDFGEINLRTISITKAVTLPATPPASPTYTNSFNFSIACTANNGLTPTPANGTAASFAVAAGTPVNVTNVVEGASCTVTELAPLPTLSSVAFSWSAIPAPVTQTVGASTPAFAFTNAVTRNVRDVQITKSLTGAPAGFSPSFPFVIISCSAGETPSSASFSLSTGQSTTISGLSVGATCSLVEQNRPAAPAGYRWKLTAGQNQVGASLTAATPVTRIFTVTATPDPNVVTFLNELEPDTRPVTVTKVIAGATDGTPPTGTYSFTLTACSSGPVSYAQQDLTAAQVAASTPLTFPNVQIGATCTLNEIARPAAPNGFAWTTTLPATRSITIGLAGAPAAQAETFTNTLERRYQLGNRLFFDTSGNGTREATETSGPVGVTVVLTDSAGAALYRQADGSVSTNTAGTLISTLTDAAGLYVFNDLPAGTYAVRVPSNQFAAGGPLAGYLSSPDGSGNNADNGVGTSPTAGTSGIAGGILSTPRTFAATGAPTAEADGALPAGAPVYPDNQSDTTLDLGFYRLSVTAAVWKDDGNNAATPANINNGVFDSGEQGIQGVRVELYNGSTLVAVTTTGPGGVYTFNQGTDANGVPNGLPLVPGSAYQVRIPQATPTVNTSLSSLASSAASGASETTPLGAANDDSGVGTAAASAGVTSSANFTLGAGTNAGANSVANNTTGTTNQPNLDFGFAPSYSVGNRVWNDLNNNGILDGAEVGLQGVTVRLLDASGNPVPGVATQTTDTNGYYRFDGLPAGNYIVEIAPPAVNGVNYVSSTGTNASATGPYEPGSSSTAAANNNQDHGTQTTPTTIRSGVIAVGPNSLVSGDGDAGATGAGAPGPNGDIFDVATVDFGIFLPAKLGNLVWNDVNKNGTADVGEAGLNGVSVILRDVNGIEITRQVTRNNPVTGAPGYYQFDYLIPGQYRVEFSAPGYFGTTPGTPAITSGTGPDTNNSQIVPGRDLGTTQLVTVAPGDNNPQLDAGYIVPPVEVPTLSELMKLLLAMMMLSVGVIAVRARKS